MRNLILFLTFLIPVLFISCEEKQLNEVWPPVNFAGAARPVITKVYPDPATSDKDSVSFAGVGIIYIEGENFSDKPIENTVHFNGKLGETLESNSTLLKVRIANVVGDSIVVKLNVTGSLLYATYKENDFYAPFKTKNAARSYLAIDQNTDISGLAVDENDNVYVLTTQKKILKISNPESDAVVFADAIFIVAPGMRMGPDSLLYITRGTKSLYTVGEGGKTARLISYNNKVGPIDFDVNKNLFAGGKGETIEVLKASDGTDETVADYSGYEITSLRVFDGYVYVSGKYTGDDSLAMTQAIWKNQILDSDGNLGTNELVLDWGTFVGDNGPDITAITFDEDGEMYIGQNKDGAIYMLNSNEYFYPQILTSPSTNLTWGNGDYLYVSKHPDDPAAWDLVRVEVTKKGAIYYGR
jgi:IPT/TIG domain